jgi:hypothetical protein
VSARRLGILVTSCAAIVTVAVLALSGSRPFTARTFALGTENNFQVAVLHPGDQVCEGPVAGSDTSNGVGIWGGGIAGPAAMTVSARDPDSGRTLAVGPLRAQAVEARWTGRLDHTFAPRRPVQICLHEDAGTFTLSGAPPVRSNVVMSGKSGPAAEFSMVLLSVGRRSLLRWLPTAFKRASLWRPSWVGEWTFWVLLIALLAAFALSVRAVASAAEDDGPLDGTAGDGSPPQEGPDDPDPMTPRSDDPLEPSEDRPQPVT